MKADEPHRRFTIIPRPHVHSKAWNPFSVELRLGRIACQNNIQIPHNTKLQGWMIGPRQFLLGHTDDTVHIPTDVVAQVVSKPSIARRGVLVYPIAGIINPGYNGKIELGIVNLSSEPVVLTRLQRICQLVLNQIETEKKDTQ